jgi:hypothetical protein
LVNRGPGRANPNHFVYDWVYDSVYDFMLKVPARKATGQIIFKIGCHEI